MSRVIRSGVGLALLMTSFAVGCGESSDEVAVSGRVTIDGQPVPRGSVSFVPLDGGTATGGGPIQDGVYTARVPRGEKVVLVLGNKLVGEEPLYEGVPDSPTRNKYEMITPEAYNAKHLSPLRANISEPRDDLDFELSGDVPAR